MTALISDYFIHNDIMFISFIMIMVIGLRLFLLKKHISKSLIVIIPIVNSWILLLFILFSCYLFGKDAIIILCIAMLFKSLHEIIRLWYKNHKFPNKIDTIFFVDILFLLSVIVFIFSLLNLSILLFVNKQQSILLFILFCIQINDVCQYIMGKIFGHKFFKIKLAKSISPNKTIEGAIFGVVLMSILSIPIAKLLTPFTIYQSIFLAMLFGILGIMGDLFQSYIKRKHMIKDMGFWLKGHGGLLDRIDSLLFSVPIFYIIYLLFFN